MLRTYKYNGHMWRYEEGEQPEGAVLVAAGKEAKETPENRASKAPAKRRAARAKKTEE